MRSLVAGALLAGPTALAFASGGFFDRPRTIAGLVAWGAVAALALSGAPLPRGRAAWVALAGLAGLTAWAAVSMSWAPLAEPARDDVGRLILYTGALSAAAMAWHARREARMVEPALAAGALVVMLYGLSERLLPGLVDLERSATGAGRLEQPLTYWNATGALAAIGLILAVRVAGDPARHPILRAAGAAAAAPFGMALYLTFSRGAIAALAVGVAVLLAVSPTRSQLRAAGSGVAAALAAALVASLLPAVETLEGASRARDGAVALAALAVLAAAGGAWQLRVARQEVAGRRALREYALPRRAVAIGLAAIVLIGGPLTAVAIDRGEGGEPVESGPTASRLADLGSNRYDYWGVALATWRDAPVRGTGIAGFRVAWLREREIDEPVRDAHSLYLETAAELGAVGLLLLALLVGGVAAAAAAALRHEREMVAGAAAAVSAFGVHAALDWDWEMPALSLPALVLAGLLLCRSDLRTAGGRAG